METTICTAGMGLSATIQIITELHDWPVEIEQDGPYHLHISGHEGAVTSAVVCAEIVAGQSLDCHE